VQVELFLQGISINFRDVSGAFSLKLPLFWIYDWLFGLAGFPKVADVVWGWKQLTVVLLNYHNNKILHIMWALFSLCFLVLPKWAEWRFVFFFLLHPTFLNHAAEVKFKMGILYFSKTKIMSQSWHSICIFVLFSLEYRLTLISKSLHSVWLHFTNHSRFFWIAVVLVQPSLMENPDIVRYQKTIYSCGQRKNLFSANPSKTIVNEAVK